MKAGRMECEDDSYRKYMNRGPAEAMAVCLIGAKGRGREGEERTRGLTAACVEHFSCF